MLNVLVFSYIINVLFLFDGQITQDSADPVKCHGGRHFLQKSLVQIGKVILLAINKRIPELLPIVNAGSLNQAIGRKLFFRKRWRPEKRIRIF